MKKKGVEIIVENVERIFKQFVNLPVRNFNNQNGTYRRKYELAKEKLSFPLKEVVLEGTSDGKTYQLRAKIYFQLGQYHFTKYLSLPKKINPTIPRKIIAKNFNLSQADGIVFVLNQRQEEEFAIGTNKLPFTLIEIASGPGLEITKKCAIPTKKLLGLEDFKKDLRRFGRITETTLQGIYEKNHREPPKIKLYIRPEENSTCRQVNQDSLLPVVIKNPKRQEERTSFKDIGGQEKAKKEIQNLSFALSNPDLYRHWGTKPPKGILLFGPPGTGKTLMAKALANETKASFHTVKIAEMTSKWYGDSEKRMQNIFDTARKNIPSIIFFDELDAIASERDFSHEATGRMVSTMLENLDGINSASGIIVIASTNRLDAIDPAIKRPGRIDRLIEVPLPDDEGRAHILGIHLFRAEKLAERPLCQDIDIAKIVYLTKGMSGADLAEIVRRVLEKKVHQAANGEKPQLISTKDLSLEIQEYERNRKLKNSIGFKNEL